MKRAAAVVAAVVVLAVIPLAYVAGTQSPKPADSTVLKVLKDDGCYYYTPLFVQCGDGQEPRYVGVPL